MKNRRAFTALELAVSVAVAAVIGAITFSFFTSEPTVTGDISAKATLDAGLSAVTSLQVNGFDTNDISLLIERMPKAAGCSAEDVSQDTVKVCSGITSSQGPLEISVGSDADGTDIALAVFNGMSTCWWASYTPATGTTFGAVDNAETCGGNTFVGLDGGDSWRNPLISSS